MAKVTSISSLGWARYTLYEALPRMAARGFKRVEIISQAHPDAFHFNYDSPTPGELKKMLDSYGLTPVCLNFHAGDTDAWDPTYVDLFVANWTRKLKQLPEVGIPMMVMLFGERNDRDDQESQLANAVKAYDRVAEIATEYGVKMVIEAPHVWTITHRPEHVRYVLDHVSNKQIGILVDSSHWGVIGYDLDEFFGFLGDRLAHIHLRDSYGPDRTDFKQELERTPGKGSVDFRKFGESLDAVGYKGDVSLEFEYRNMTFDAIEAEYDFGLKHLVDCGWEIPDGVKPGSSLC